MTITLITLILLTIGNIIFMSRVNKKIINLQEWAKDILNILEDKVSRIEFEHLNKIQDIHRIQIENYGTDIYKLYSAVEKLKKYSKKK